MILDDSVVKMHFWINKQSPSSTDENTNFSKKQVFSVATQFNLSQVKSFMHAKENGHDSSLNAELLAIFPLIERYAPPCDVALLKPFGFIIFFPFLLYLQFLFKVLYCFDRCSSCFRSF